MEDELLRAIPILEVSAGAVAASAQPGVASLGLALPDRRWPTPSQPAARPPRAALAPWPRPAGSVTSLVAAVAAGSGAAGGQPPSRPRVRAPPGAARPLTGHSCQGRFYFAVLSAPEELRYSATAAASLCFSVDSELARPLLPPPRCPRA